MAVKKPSRIRRLFRFLWFPVLPIFMIAGIIWQGYGIVQALARQLNERSIVESREGIYTSTLTAVIPTLQTNTPVPTATFTPSATATATASPTPTATYTPTATPTVTVTPSPTATPTTRPTFAPTATAQPTLVAQAPILVSNTPNRPSNLVLATNTSAAPIPSATSTPTPTSLPAPTQTLAPTIGMTSTPRPLPTVYFYEDTSTNPNAAPTAIPTRVPLIDRAGQDLVNIILLGGDNELTEDNVDRTDTMIVVSINRTTNTVSMMSFPRDLYVYIPGWTMQRLNLAYTHGEQVGWSDGGFGLLRQTFLYNFGINIHYYIKVNLSGFKEIIDTLGGVNIAVDCAIQAYPLIGAEPPPEAERTTEDGLRTLPVGYYRLLGEGALWYARSRDNSSDFDRGRRQMQILRSVWREARSSGQITNLPQLWSQVTEVVETDLAFEDMIGLLPYAINLDPAQIEHLLFIRTYHTIPWQPPDGQNVQLPVYEAVSQLMTDFYTPPTQNQIEVQADRIAVYNGTTNANWDRVAAERLGWGGFNAIASGNAPTTDYTETILIDRTGELKGSSLEEIAELLNVRPENIREEPDPNRTADYEVILGSNYNSCTFAVLDPSVLNEQ
jgi:polyisoprenyl-teichoic acid--peptidoglycan teichoic acid transferase